MEGAAFGDLPEDSVGCILLETDPEHLQQIALINRLTAKICRDASFRILYRERWNFSDLMLLLRKWAGSSDPFVYVGASYDQPDIVATGNRETVLDTDVDRGLVILSI
jgi:hypothetical protein